MLSLRNPHNIASHPVTASLDFAVPLCSQRGSQKLLQHNGYSRRITLQPLRHGRTSVPDESQSGEFAEYRRQCAELYSGTEWRQKADRIFANAALLNIQLLGTLGQSGETHSKGADAKIEGGKTQNENV